MSFADTAVLFVLALLLFGPKKLPGIARQVGKALNEFKRASNEFKAQIEAEISQMEIQERQKKAEEERKALPAAVQTAAAPEGSVPSVTSGSQVESPTEPSSAPEPAPSVAEPDRTPEPVDSVTPNTTNA